MNIRLPSARALAALALALASLHAQAQYTANPSFFQPPSTQLGGANTGASLLVLSTTNADIDVIGQFAVTLPAGPSNGTLVRWVVDRPLVVNSLFSNFVTKTLLDGFSLPPTGAVANTAGVVRTFITDLNVPNSVIGNSLSSIAVSLSAGFTTWTQLSATSAPFTLLTGTNFALRQVFELDGVYLSGAGGTWLIDVPVLSGISAVPEHTSSGLLLLGLAGLLLRLTGRRGMQVGRRRLAACPTPAWALPLLVLAGPAAAQFMGPAVFSTPPESQIASGPGLDQLLISNNLSDFTVTGTYSVPVAAGPANGVVARWAVERPLNLNLNMGFQTLTLLIGFSAPPPGTFNPSVGFVDTYIYNLATSTTVPGSYFSIPFNLVNGAATWATASVSPTYMLVTGNQRHVLRQEFVMFGDYVAGPGGTWTVDVPITTSLTAVPEPPISLMFAAAGLLAVLRRWLPGR